LYRGLRWRRTLALRSNVLSIAWACNEIAIATGAAIAGADHTATVSHHAALAIQRQADVTA